MPIRRINRGRGHSYTIDGKKAVGVTTALGIINKPALPLAAAKVLARRVLDMDEDGFRELKSMPDNVAFWDLAQTHTREWSAKATRGTNVHTFAEKIIGGAEVEVPDELYGHVQSAVRFMDDWQVTPILVEKVIGDYAYGYAGTFDLVGELPGGRRVLFDYKTNKNGIYPETALQLAGYRYASHYVADYDSGVELPMSEVGIDACMAVHLRADGYDVVPLVTDEVVFGAFVMAVRLYRAMQDAKTWVVGAITPAEFAPVEHYTVDVVA